MGKPTLFGTASAGTAAHRLLFLARSFPILLPIVAVSNLSAVAPCFRRRLRRCSDLRSRRAALFRAVAPGRGALNREPAQRRPGHAIARLLERNGNQRE